MSGHHHLPAVAATLAAFALAGCSALSTGSEPPVARSITPTPASVPDPITVRGILLLYSGGVPHQPCSGDKGYEDIRAGTQVTVKDARGLRLAIGQLEPGITKHRYFCKFEFTVPEVPSDGSLYHINVSNRGGDTYTREELKKRIRITLP